MWFLPLYPSSRGQLEALIVDLISASIPSQTWSKFRGGRAQILPLLRCGNWRVFEFQSSNKVVFAAFRRIQTTLKLPKDVCFIVGAEKLLSKYRISGLFLFEIEGTTSPPPFRASSPSFSRLSWRVNVTTLYRFGTDL